MSVFRYGEGWSHSQTIEAALTQEARGQCDPGAVCCLGCLLFGEGPGFDGGDTCLAFKEEPHQGKETLASLAERGKTIL